MSESLSFLSDQWTRGSGERISVVSPYDGMEQCQFRANTAEEIELAVQSAAMALPSWSGQSLEQRTKLLETYAELIRQHAESIAQTLSQEVGKPHWEALTEVNAMVGKVALSVQAHSQRCAVSTRGNAHTRFKPHGVMAVLGPYNFPCHLPNGHIVPALLAGNTVVFKPSEFTPRSSAWIPRLLLEAGLPAGAIQLVQGSRATGEALVRHQRIDGLAFTGSVTTGESIARQVAATPGKIVALELGGNNPLVLWDVKDLHAAVLTILQSAFVTAGQRCTCARRLILSHADAKRLRPELVQRCARIRVGAPHEKPEPFCGPVIRPAVARELLAAQEALVRQGAEPWHELRLLRPDTGLLQPGILDVTAVSTREDREFFGPLLQVIRVDSFEAALEEANRTQFGLAAGLLSDDSECFEQFYRDIRAGVVNWNVPLPGASGAAPFGGIARSGNFRPSGFFAADYCSYPVASMEEPTLQMPETPLPGLWT